MPTSFVEPTVTIRDYQTMPINFPSGIQSGFAFVNFNALLVPPILSLAVAGLNSFTQNPPQSA